LKGGGKVYFKTAARKSELNPGQIAPECSSHTAEEWLEIMQEKSQVQGEKLSWWQIKQDPELNHKEIMNKLGPYAKYEDKLFQKEKASYDPVKPEEAKLELVSNPKVKPKTASLPKSNIVRLRDNDESGKPEKVCLGKITAPPNRTWKKRGLIVISKINKEGAEEHVNLEQLEMLNQGDLKDFQSNDLQRLFAGLDENRCICELIVGQNKISAKVRYKDSSSMPTIVFRLLPKEKIELFIGLVIINDEYDYENYDYIICECVGSQSKQSIKIVDSRFYNTV